MLKSYAFFILSILIATTVNAQPLPSVEIAGTMYTASRSAPNTLEVLGQEPRAMMTKPINAAGIAALSKSCNEDGVIVKIINPGDYEQVDILADNNKFGSAWLAEGATEAIFPDISCKAISGATNLTFRFESKI